MVNQTFEVVLRAVPRQSLRARSKCESAPGPSGAKLAGDAWPIIGMAAITRRTARNAAPSTRCRFQNWLFIAVAAPSPQCETRASGIAPLPFLCANLLFPSPLLPQREAQGAHTTSQPHITRAEAPASAQGKRPSSRTAGLEGAAYQPLGRQSGDAPRGCGAAHAALTCRKILSWRRIQRALDARKCSLIGG